MVGLPPFMQDAMAKAMKYASAMVSKKHKATKLAIEISATGEDGELSSDMLQIKTHPNINANKDRYSAFFDKINESRNLLKTLLTDEYQKTILDCNSKLSADTLKLPKEAIERKKTEMKEIVNAISTADEDVDKLVITDRYDYDEIWKTAKAAMSEHIVKTEETLNADYKVKQIPTHNILLESKRKSYNGQREDENSPGNAKSSQTNDSERRQNHQRVPGISKDETHTLLQGEQATTRTILSGQEKNLPIQIPKSKTRSIAKSKTPTEGLAVGFDKEDIKPNFKILTKQLLPDKFIKILNKGYKFTPFTKGINYEELMNEFNLITKQIDDKCERLDNNCDSFERIQETNKYIASIYISSCNNTCNAIETDIIKNTAERLNLIIRESDKGLGFCVMDSSWYYIQMKRHLGDTETYEQLEYFPIGKIKRELIKILNTFKDVLPKSDRERIFTAARNHDSNKLPEIYLIPKIHKNPVKTRPVVPEFDSITKTVSKFLDKILQPLVHKHKWILGGTGDLIDMLESTTIDLKDPIIMSADIVSMYTSIHTNQGIALVTQVMKEYNIPKNKILCYQQLLKWLFNNNYFKFNNTLYRQKRGAPMGSSCIPTFANLLMARIEATKIFTNITSERPMPIYGRLIDDTIMVIERTDVGFWKDIFLKCNQYLDFTFDSSIDNNSVPMLDLNLFVGPKFASYRKLDFIGYQKPFNNNIYTAPDSYVPLNYRFSWIIGENIRLIRNNDNEEAYQNQLKEYVDSLLKRGYDNAVILQHLKYNYEDRPNILKQISKLRKDMHPILIPHTEGYEHLVQASKIYYKLAKASFYIPSITPIVMRGTNLRTIANKSNRTQLLNSNIQNVTPS
jgi:hypothetical protein